MIIRFILMCCRDGEFDKPKVFNSYEQAYNEMKNEYKTVLGWNPDIEEMNHEISDYDAWVEVADHQTYWGIAEISI